PCRLSQPTAGSQSDKTALSSPEQTRARPFANRTPISSPANQTNPPPPPQISITLSPLATPPSSSLDPPPSAPCGSNPSVLYPPPPSPPQYPPPSHRWRPCPHPASTPRQAPSVVPLHRTPPLAPSFHRPHPPPRLCHPTVDARTA